MNCYIEKTIKENTDISNDFPIIIYGSFVNTPYNCRDVDVIAISDIFKKSELKEIEIDFNSTKKIINAYYVTKKDLFDDIIDLKYGGYYSDKFAFNFKIISEYNEAISYIKYYWLYKLHQYYDHTQCNQIDILSFFKYTYDIILKYNPCFIRAYKKNESYLIEIRNFVTREVISDYFDKKDQIYLEKYNQSSLESTFFQFWSLYDRYKCAETANWGEKTYKKILYSCKYGSNE